MPRHHDDRQALRCAYQVLDVLEQTRSAALQDHARWVEQVLGQLPQVTHTATQFVRSVARARGSVASRILARRLQHQFQITAREMQALSGRLACETCPPTPSLRDLLAELDQLESEFGGWAYDASACELSVTTENISLEGVELGPFEVHLRLGQPVTQLIGHFCSAQALEPNPAASNPEVTHPHVSGEAICVGDFGPDLVRSLRGGRICDFFLMIRSILTTYNAHSPYVSLDEWHGEPCSDCGRSVDEDGRYCCEACDRSVCDDCISSCPHCDSTLCYGCVTMCRGCEKSSCAECLAPCADCGDLVCPDCIEDDHCPNCLENRDDEDDPEEETSEEEQATCEEQDAGVT